MTDPVRAFPDVQRVLVDDLEAVAGVGHTGVETPADLAGALPFIRVLRLGGGSDWLNDQPSIDVDVFAATYTAAEQMAEQVRSRLVGPPPSSPVLDRVVCDTGPRELPWGDKATMRRFGASYTVTTRQRRTL